MKAYSWQIRLGITCPRGACHKIHHTHTRSSQPWSNCSMSVLYDSCHDINDAHHLPFYITINTKKRSPASCEHMLTSSPVHQTADAIQLPSPMHDCQRLSLVSSLDDRASQRLSIARVQTVESVSRNAIGWVVEEFQERGHLLSGWCLIGCHFADPELANVVLLLECLVFRNCILES